jgi:hypothetical protein
VGWGELTFVKQVWPDVPVIGLFEYFFRAEGGSVGFDPEFPASDQAAYTMHARNAVNFANIQTVDLGHAPDPLAARHLSRKLPPQALRLP